MRNAVLALSFLILGFGIAWFGLNMRDSPTQIHESSTVITERISRISKLMVAEGHYSQVFTHSDSKQYFYDLLQFERKAILLINAKVLVSYDLEKMDYKLDEENKVLLITTMPEPETDIVPDVQYYDLQQSDFHSFSPEELNALNERAIARIEEQVATGNLYEEAKRQVRTSLEDLTLVAQTEGWTIEWADSTLVNELELGF